MKFFVPPAGGLFCFRRPQSAPPAKPASRASQQTPSSAVLQAPIPAKAMSAVRKASYPRSSATPKAGKPRFRAEPATPKVAPFCLEKLRRPAKKPQPPQSGKAPVRKQAVAHTAASKPSASCGRARSEKPRQTAVSRMRALRECRKAGVRRPTFRWELRCRKTPQMRGKPREPCREFRTERPRPAGQNRGAKRKSALADN